jgi:hypothetical protein
VLFAAELKVTLAGGVDDALAALGLDPADGQARRIGFIEDRRGGPGTLPLLDAGVVLRVRENGGDDDDSTVKFRPCVPSQVSDEDRAADDVSVEEDWAGTRRVLAASYKADRPAGRVAAAWDGDDRLGRLFTDDQERFLAAGAHDVAVDLDLLTLLPPITATRWKGLALPDLDLPVVAERWVVGTLDFLELSIRVEATGSAGDAEQAKRALEAGVQARGLTVPVEQETKTRTVLEFLAR